MLYVFQTVCKVSIWIYLFGFAWFFLSNALRIIPAFNSIPRIRIEELSPFHFSRNLNDNISDHPFKWFFGHFFIVTSIMGLVWLATANTSLGTKDIGSLFERDEYTVYRFVNITPEGSQSKSYNVIARIEAQDKFYIMTDIYWPNGGTNYFDQEEYNSVDSEYWSTYVDNEDRTWKVLLLDRRASVYDYERVIHKILPGFSPLGFKNKDYYITNGIDVFKFECKNGNLQTIKSNTISLGSFRKE